MTPTQEVERQFNRQLFLNSYYSDYYKFINSIPKMIIGGLAIVGLVNIIIILWIG